VPHHHPEQLHKVRMLTQEERVRDHLPCDQVPLLVGIETPQLDIMVANPRRAIRAPGAAVRAGLVTSVHGGAARFSKAAA